LHGALGGEWRSALVADPLGRPVEARWLALPDGTAVVESAAAIGLPLLTDGERDPLRASSSGLGELMLAALAGGPARLLVCLGGSATVDGGAGLREALGAAAGALGAGALGAGALGGVRLDVACDVRNPLLGERGAARVFGPQKGATPEVVEELERRLAALAELGPYAALPGAGAAGGLGAALAALGGRLVPGAGLVLETVRFRERAARAALVVTGEGTVDRTTVEGKAPGAVLAACAELGRRCVLFGGRVVEAPAGADARPLSGDPAHATDDLRTLGARLARELAG
jgi:glycerate kinase